MVNLKEVKFKLTRRLKVFFSFFISFLLILQIIPPVFSSSDSDVSFETSDFGILRALDTLLDDKEVRLNSAEIKNETENRLNQMTLTKSENEEPELDYQVKSVHPRDPRKDEPIIFEAIKKETIATQNDIIDFLLDQPLNYYIYTRVGGTSTWTKATLRPTIVIPKFNPWRWENIDVDNNSANGDEIRVRFDLVYDNILDGIQILPEPKISLSGGLGITIERLVNRSFPLELYIAKSISYEGQNYIWTTGATFDTAPIRYTSELLAESIEMQGMARNLLSGGLGNLSSATIAEINGPYSLRFSSESDLKSYDLMAGMIKYENFSLTNKNWLIFSLTPANGYQHITHSGEIWVDSSDVQAPLDNLKWTSGFYDQTGSDKIPINLRIRYTEDRDELVSANVELIDLPEWFEISLDYTKVVDGINVTVLDYSAADVLGLLNYTSYLFPDIEANPSLKTFNCTHVELEDVPDRLHMEMTTDIGRDINLSVNNNPQLGIVANVMDNLVSRLANRFYRIGRYLKLAAEGILELPTKDGYAIIDVFDEQYSRIEFYQSNGRYLAHPGNYVGFYNQSYGTNTDNNSATEILPIAISGRLSGLKYATLNFGTPLEFELRILNNEPFTGLLVDGKNYGIVEFSNVPEYVKISNLDNHSLYSTVDPEGISGTEDGTPIDQFLFAGRFDDQFLKFEINEIPGSLEFNHKEDIISFSTIDGGFIGEFKYQITNDISEPSYNLNIGDNIFIYQDDEIVTSSGMLSGLSQLTYDSSENGYFELIRDRETAFHVMLIDNKEEHTKAKLILDPLPSNFLIQLPGIVKSSSLELPDFTNFSQGMDMSKMVFTLGSLGEEAIKLLGNLSQGFIDSIGNIGVNFSISYELESVGSTLDLIAEIERGGLVEGSSGEGGLGSDPYSTMTEEVLGTEVGWTHGICMLAEEHEGVDVLRGHLYLQGMPRIASLKSSFTFNTTKVDLDFREYYPRHSWLLIDLKGIQDRDVNVFFQRIPSGVDFQASVNLTTNLEIGGELIGDVDISIRDTGSDSCSKPLGALYVYMHTYLPIQSIREFFISKMTSDLHIDFAIQKEVRMLYEASEEIEFIYSKLSKILTESWHHVTLILHDLPERFNFKFLSNEEFNMDDPLPLQGMPTLEMDTDGPARLDILISLDGAAVGQRGNIDLFMQNIPDTWGRLEENTYRIDSENLEYLRLKITDLPILDNYKLNYIILEAEDLSSLKFEVNLLFGVFPFFDLGSDSRGKIEVIIDHTITLFGQKMRAQVALIDLIYENVAGVRIPMGTPMYVNMINSDLTDTREHVIIPAPLLSFYMTWLGNL